MHPERNRYGRLESERKHRHAKRQHDHPAKHAKGCPPNPPIDGLNRTPWVLAATFPVSQIRTYSLVE